MDQTNPKDLLGVQKLMLDAVSPFAEAHEALAMMDGHYKYGPFNWRSKKVRARVYIAAALRHLKAWAEREEEAGDSHCHHLGHARACLGILIDAMETGNLIDDRATAQDKTAYTRMMEQLTVKIAAKLPAWKELEANRVEREARPPVIAPEAPTHVEETAQAVELAFIERFESAFSQRWTAVFMKLVEILHTMLDGRTVIQAGSRFVEDLGLDSLDLFELVVLVENVFDIEADEDRASKLLIMADAVNYILELLPADWSPLKPQAEETISQ